MKKTIKELIDSVDMSKCDALVSFPDILLSDLHINHLNQVKLLEKFPNSFKVIEMSSYEPSVIYGYELIKTDLILFDNLPFAIISYFYDDEGLEHTDIEYASSNLIRIFKFLIEPYLVYNVSYYDLEDKIRIK